MLKKISKILMISLISIMLVGCGSSNITEVDLKSVSSTIEKSLKNMEVVDDSTLEDVYDLDLSLMKEHIVKQNDDGDLYALIKTDDTVKVKAGFAISVVGRIIRQKMIIGSSVPDHIFCPLFLKSRQIHLISSLLT